MNRTALTIFCPSCGFEGQTANAYCKRCGEWLPDFKTRSRLSFGGDTPQQNVLTNLVMSALSTVFALVSAVALYVTYLGTAEAKWSIYLAAGFCLCIAGWQASSFLVAMKLQRRLKRARTTPAKTAEIESPASTPSLNPADFTLLVMPQSVTENTTALLDPVETSHQPNNDR